MVTWVTRVTCIIGEESLYKAGRLAKNMPEEKGQELIAFIKKSNNEMEMSCRA